MNAVEKYQFVAGFGFVAGFRFVAKSILKPKVI